MSNTINLEPEVLEAIIRKMQWRRELRKQYAVETIAKRYNVTPSKVYSVYNAFLAKRRL